MPKLTEMNVSEVRQIKRVRKDLGDLVQLAHSIETVGLLHPIVVTKERRLVAGERRLAAFKQLGRKRVPTYVVESLDDALTLLLAERDENTCRKDFTPMEVYAVDQRLRPLEEKAAKERMSDGGKEAGRGRQRKGGAKLAPPKVKSRDLIARAAGVSHGTLEKIRKVAEAAERAPKKWESIIAEMEETGNVDRAYREVRRQDREKNLRTISRGNKRLGTEKTYAIIYADPPWKYDHPDSVTPSRSIANQYPQMELEEICELPVRKLSTPDAMLFLWVPSPLIFKAADVMDAWGFEYRTQLVWDKEALGSGHYVRMQHEVLLIAVHGDPITPREKDRPRSILRQKKSSKHSEKPEQVVKLIEKMYPRLPKIELWARARRKGWDAWGNQAD